MRPNPVTVARRAVRNLANAARGIPAVILANLLLTRRCTQACLQCSIPESAGDSPHMPFGTFTGALDLFARHGTQFVSLSGGEPLLHPRLEDCIRYAARGGFIHVQLLSTLYAGEAAVERTVATLLETGTGVQVSFDGFGEVADRLRGATGVSDRVMRGMELLTRGNRRLRRPVRTSANIVISRLNLHQVPDILRYIEGLGWKCNVDIYRWASDNQRECAGMKLVDGPELRRVLDIVRSSRAVTTPRAIIDGFPAWLRGEQPKRCPYLTSRGFGTKLYVNPDASVSVCLGPPFGDLLEDGVAGLFASTAWRERLDTIRRCPGCWNTCYTPAGIVFSPRSLRDVRDIWRMR